MKDFRNCGWKYLDKMEKIIPGGGATGANAYHPGSIDISVSAPSVAGDQDVSELDDGESDHLFSVPGLTLTSASIANFNIDPSLINDAVASTATAINFALPSTSANHPPTTVQPQSTSNKRTLETMSQDDADNSLLFSQAPISTVSTSSMRTTTSKRSRTGNWTAPGGKKHENLSVAIHAFDSTIRHFDNSITTKFVDPLKCVQEATTLLYLHPTMPADHRRFLRKQFPRNPAYATQYLSLPDDNAIRCEYAADLYAEIVG